jgi:hypothetical protein
MMNWVKQKRLNFALDRKVKVSFNAIHLFVSFIHALTIIFLTLLNSSNFLLPVMYELVLSFLMINIPSLNGVICTIAAELSIYILGLSEVMLSATTNKIYVTSLAVGYHFILPSVWFKVGSPLSLFDSQCQKLLIVLWSVFPHIIHLFKFLFCFCPCLNFYLLSLAGNSFAWWPFSHKRNIFGVTPII